MSASKNQACAQARPRTEEPHNPATRGAARKRSAFALKAPRNLSLATGVIVALLGIASLGQASIAVPETTEVQRASQASVKAAEAPGHNKPSIAPFVPAETVAPQTEPAPEAVSEPAPALTPVVAVETPSEPAVAPAPVADPAPTTPMPNGVAGNWTMAFSDEFNGSALDTSKWSNCWFSPTCGEMNKVGTSPNNVSVSGGNLALSLSSPTSGALVSSNPKGGAGTGYQFTTGYVEARIKFPGDANGLYNWPAFWTNGQTWPTNGENDIAEVLDTKMTVNYHSASGAHNQGSVSGNWSNEYHTFGLHRTATSADVYYDGVKVKSYATDDGNAPHYLILNVGAGKLPVYGAASTVQVDYVRAWQ